MTLRYLPEHRNNALLALDLARKAVQRLRYSQQTLFTQSIDVNWVQQLSQNDDQAEKVEAFVSRFGRLQDYIGEKLVPRFATLLGESPKSMLDMMVYAEKMQWINNAEEFFSIRKLRNLLIHEYMSDAQLFLDALLAARDATEMLFQAVQSIETTAARIRLI